jgi:hypothetical protein
MAFSELYQFLSGANHDSFRVSRWCRFGLVSVPAVRAGCPRATRPPPVGRRASCAGGKLSTDPQGLARWQPIGRGPNRLGRRPAGVP